MFASDPLTVDNEVVYPMIYPADTALPVIPKMGCRTGDTIKIDSISVKLRVRMKESTQNAYSNKIEATFALFRVHKNYVVSNAIPAVRELFAAGRYRPWNYSSRIDTPTEELLGEPWKIKKLVEKTFYLTSDDRYPYVKSHTMFWKPKHAVTHKFIQGSADGYSLEYKYLLAARSNMPNVVDAAIQDCQPSFHACVFMNYHE